MANLAQRVARASSNVTTRNLSIHAHEVERLGADAKQVRRNRRLNKMICNEAEDSPMLYVEEVVELSTDADLKEWVQGFVFYTEEDESESTA